MLSFLVALLASLFCPSETAWVEYTDGAYTAVCGDADGNPL